jgi:hypothetical protein
MIDGANRAAPRIERRIPPRGRRLRDRLASREGTSNPTLAARYELQNLLLLVDDDLRETALALGAIEQFLGSALSLLEHKDVTAEEIGRLAGDGEVVERIDTLTDALDQLRRRLGAVASALK